MSFDPTVPIEDAWTPPAKWYIEEEFLRREGATVFAKHWLCAARTAQLESPRSYVAFNQLQRQGVAVRGADGVLRAFHNVCRHHAARLLAGEGQCDEVVCPYHGWTYGLDGRLARAPRCGGIVGFRREDFGLLPMQVGTLGPLVFVHQDPHPLPVDHGLDNLLDALDTQDMRWVGRREYRMRCNWKVFVDNYLDGGYHVAVAHPQLAGGLDLDSYQTTTFARHSVQTCASLGQERLGDGALYAWVYPNLMLNRYGPVLDTNVVWPIGARETLVVFDWWVEAHRANDTAFVAETIAASDRVQQEDSKLSESVQQGLESGAFVRGRYAPKVEMAMHHFHRLLAQDL